jgi:hypothetical protein
MARRARWGDVGIHVNFFESKFETGVDGPVEMMKTGCDCASESERTELMVK